MLGAPTPHTNKCLNPQTPAVLPRAAAKRKVLLAFIVIVCAVLGLYYFQGHIFSRIILEAPDELLVSPLPSSIPAASTAGSGSSTSPASRSSPVSNTGSGGASRPVAIPSSLAPSNASSSVVSRPIVNPAVYYNRPPSNFFVDLSLISQKCDAIHTGVQDCLDYLRDREDEYLIRRQAEVPPCDADHPLYFHAYWRGLMGKGLIWILKSFLFTQRLDCARYVLWTEGTIPLNLTEIATLVEKERLDDEEILRKGIPVAPVKTSRKYPKIKMSTHYESVIELEKMAPYIEVRSFNLSDQLRLTSNLTDSEWRHYVDAQILAGAFKKVDTALATDAAKKEYQRLNSTYPWPRNEKPKDPRFKWPLAMLQPTSELHGNAVSDSDTVRFILLYNHGGLYVDTDVVFLRDMRPWFFTAKPWSSSWALQDHYNTALLKADRGDPIMARIMEKGIAAGTKFHPYQLVGYLKGYRKGSHHLNSLSADSLLTLVPSGVFDSAWPWVEGNKKPYMPNVDLSGGLFIGKSDREKEFAVIKNKLGAKHVKTSDIRVLRTLENLYEGSPAFHCHGIGFPIEKDSWVDILFEHYNCFVDRTCRNIYNEMFP